jgi:hypothetical protein
VPWAFLERRYVRLTALARGDRVAVTARVRDAFIEAHAWITDVHFFSGLSTTLGFEVDATRLPALERALEAAGLTLDEESRAAVRAIGADAGEVQGTLCVTFVHGDPDLRHEVPSVPG